MRNPSNVTEYEMGELVHPYWVDQFVTCLPPETNTSTLIQLGEPYSSVEGRTTFLTLKKTAEGWIYAGECFSGQSEPAWGGAGR